MPRKKKISDEAVLAVARDFFLRDGVSASTRAIAKQVGVSETVLFQRFQTKEALFFSAMMPPAIELDAIFTVNAGEGTVCENLQAILLKIFQKLREAMPVFVKLIGHPSFDFAEFMSSHAVPTHQISGRLSEYLSAEASLGRVDDEFAESAAELLFHAIHNAALLSSLVVPHAEEPEVYSGRIIGVVWNGLKPEKSKSN